VARFAGMTKLEPSVVRALTEIVGSGHVLTDPDVTSGYATDWTGRFVGSTPAVVRPGSTDEVQAVVGLCRRHGVGLALQGGNTGLSGGAVPLAGEVICSLRRLTGIEVDATDGQATVGAGTTLGDLQAAARAAGWDYGVDIASRDSATVGGTVATNAGGVRVLRYGDTRAQLLGVSSVLGSGLVVSHMQGLLKDNTGYHLAGLLCGSEGTLGVVTEARVRLVPRSPERVVALLAFGDAGAAVEAASTLRRALTSLSAAELFFAAGMTLVRTELGLPDPFDRAHAAYLLVEAADDRDPTPALSEAVASVPGVADAVVAPDGARAVEPLSGRPRRRPPRSSHRFPRGASPGPAG